MCGNRSFVMREFLLYHPSFKFLLDKRLEFIQRTVLNTRNITSNPR